MSERKAINLNKLTPQQLKARESLGTNDEVALSGLINKNIVEPNPSFDAPECAQGITNANNAGVWLLRDMPAGKESGYGGKGHTGAGAVYIVVGRMASVEGGPDSNAIVTNNFFTDAAGIYLSQKTDIDKNYTLVGDSKVGRSGIGIKADAVRIIGREGVKIVSGKGKNLDGTGKGGEKNSQGGKIEKIAGIELIAGNDVSAEKLEPLVKAYALSETLQKLVDRIQDLSDVVVELAKSQTKINNTIKQHTHPITNTGVQVSPDLYGELTAKEINKMSNVHQNLYKHKINLGNTFVDTRLSPTGKKWFGSRWNKTN